MNLLWIAFVFGVPITFAIKGSSLAEQRFGHRRAFSNPGGMRFPPGEVYALAGAALGFVIVLLVAVVIS